MEMAKITADAAAFLEAFGDKAEAEATAKIRELEEAGQHEEAETWRAIRRALSVVKAEQDS